MQHEQISPRTDCEVCKGSRQVCKIARRQTHKIVGGRVVCKQVMNTKCDGKVERKAMMKNEIENNTKKQGNEDM